jgi:hypothetical protein
MSVMEESLIDRLCLVMDDLILVYRSDVYEEERLLVSIFGEESIYGLDVPPLCSSCGDRLPHWSFENIIVASHGDRRMYDGLSRCCNPLCSKRGISVTSILSERAYRLSRDTFVSSLS